MICRAGIKICGTFCLYAVTMMLGFTNGSLLGKAMESSLGIPNAVKDTMIQQAEDVGTLMQQFEEFIVNYGKSYASLAEKMTRFEIFKDNLAFIKDLMSGDTGGVVYAVNAFSDLTHEEFMSTHMGFKTPPDLKPVSRRQPSGEHKPITDKKPTEENSPAKETKKPKEEGKKDEDKTPPVGDKKDDPAAGKKGKGIDWRKTKGYPPVREQGDCGACWAFSTIGIVEIGLVIAGKKREDFSEQQLVDCTPENNPGCDGGWFPAAFKVMQTTGLTTEELLPYKGKDGTCQKNLKTVYKLKSFTDVSSTARMSAALTKGPVAIAFNANPREFQMYKSGVLNLDGKKCPPEALTHAVIVVGENKGNFILRNSWGTSWGIKGHFIMKANTCGLGTYAYSVTV